MAFISVNNSAQEITKIYVSVNGVAKEVVSGFVGVAGVAKKVYSSAIDYSKYFIYNLNITENTANVTGIKYTVWYQDFGNYDIIIPSKIEGFTTRLMIRG